MIARQLQPHNDWLAALGRDLGPFESTAPDGYRPAGPIGADSAGMAAGPFFCQVVASGGEIRERLC